jgi:hypothetical protein
MTAKQALLKGLTVSAKSRPEPMVGRMIVKLRGDALGATAQSEPRHAHEGARIHGGG